MLQVLKLPRAILFLILITPWAITYYYPFEDLRNWMSSAIFDYFVLLVWFVLLDQELMKRVPKKIEISDTLFLINAFLIFGISSVYFIFAKPGEKYTLAGIAGLLLGCYFLYAIFQIYNHLSKLLTYVEEEQEVKFSKRIGEMIMFFFFFVGVWGLQPRIIRALEKPEVLYQKYISIKEREALNERKEENQTESS